MQRLQHVVLTRRVRSETVVFSTFHVDAFWEPPLEHFTLDPCRESLCMFWNVKDAQPVRFFFFAVFFKPCLRAKFYFIPSTVEITRVQPFARVPIRSFINDAFVNVEEGDRGRVSRVQGVRVAISLHCAGRHHQLRSTTFGGGGLFCVSPVINTSFCACVSGRRV